MLQHHSLGHPRRWRFAIALIATAVIPIQLVARTPETPPQEPKREPRTVQRAKAEQQNAQERINAARRRVQQTPAGQQPRRPVERAPQLQQAPAEQDAGVLHQQAENHKRMLELMAIVREKHAHKPHQVEAQLKARIALLEQLRRYTPTTEHETLAQQYRQLAEHYERLAAEQRKLAEEVERAQREAAPVK